MAIAYPMTQIRRARLNTFWFTHQLLLIMLVTLCFHGAQSLLEPFQSVYWIMLPMTCHIVPRFLRETPMSVCPVLSVAIQKGNVMRIRLAKPKSWDKQLHAGMYAYINIPQLSRLEWHPFTMTSAPSDRYIEFHCRRVGDLTGKVHDLLQECKTGEMMKTMKELTCRAEPEYILEHDHCIDDLTTTEKGTAQSCTIKSGSSW
jgi:respiratory burst oxidase